MTFSQGVKALFVLLRYKRGTIRKFPYDFQYKGMDFYVDTLLGRT